MSSARWLLRLGPTRRTWWRASAPPWGRVVTPWVTRWWTRLLSPASTRSWLQSSDAVRLDLWESNRRQLDGCRGAVRIRSRPWVCAPVATCRIFSRIALRHGRTGRMACAIGLRWIRTRLKARLDTVRSTLTGECGASGAERRGDSRRGLEDGRSGARFGRQSTPGSAFSERTASRKPRRRSMPSPALAMPSPGTARPCSDQQGQDRASDDSSACSPSIVSAWRRNWTGGLRIWASPVRAPRGQCSG